ncbi:MAG TPA: molybdate ABC transporter permease subunit [Rhodospirillales bacterium]|jgi:molybdate transport system permease protein|nr:molybdate ABC transporter permease subunit [Rhodospirillales bacterium]HIL74238.1 molybdate ABC transporter permease subunit [Rhodospirillales bacterium]
MITPSPVELEALFLSLKVAIWSVLITLPLGLFTAWLLARKDFYGRAFVNGIVYLPLVLPPVVIGFFLLAMLGRHGPIGQLLDNMFGITVIFTWQGAAIASAIMSFPLMVRAIRISIENVDTKLEAAARTLGASPFRVFYSITLPLISPGILAGTLLAFARSLGEFGATITFVSNIPGETRTLPLAIYSLVQTPGGDTGALRLVILSVIIALMALLISEYLAHQAKRRIGD